MVGVMEETFECFKDVGLRVGVGGGGRAGEKEAAVFCDVVCGDNFFSARLGVEVTI